MNAFLFRLRRFSKNAISQDDIIASQPIFHDPKQDHNGIGILCLHGFSSTPANFYEYACSFIQQGYTVSIPLLPGHGDKPDALLNVKWTQWLDCALQNYDLIRKKCDKVFVVGLSLGALLAIQLATRRKDIEKLFLLSPAIEPIFLFKMGKYFLLPLFRILRINYWFNIGGDIKDTTQYEVGYKKIPINAFNEVWKCMQDTRFSLPLVKTDIMVFQPRIDHTTNPNGGKVIIDNVKSINKKLIYLDNTYHVISKDFDSKNVLDTILAEIDNK